MKKQQAVGATTVGGRLKQALVAAQMKQKDLAQHFDVTEQAVSQWFRGDTGPDILKIFELARLLGVRAEWIITGAAPRASGRLVKEALLVGKVGAGAEITRFDEGAVLEGIDPPPGCDGCNAAEIVGDSQYPLQDGWIVFYGAEHQGIPEEAIGKLAVVQVKDGPTLLKTLKKGSKKGFWRLESWNAPPREDVRLSWAAKVIDIRPR